MASIKLNRPHHIAIIASDYEQSKKFYVDVLGLKIISENYREERQSYKLDLSLNGEYLIELFSFPDSPARLSYPEACGLRHLAFEVDDVEACLQELSKMGVTVDELRVDPYTNKKMAFFFDPDNLPLELYER